MATRPKQDTPSTFLNPDGSLRIVSWASPLPLSALSGADEGLAISLSPRAAQMAHSQATGEGLVSNGQLGADIIRLGAGDGFVPHTHPGDHLLIVIGGVGTITVDGKIYETRAGQVYMVEGAKPHAVGAITEHVIMAIGSPHRPVDSTDRMVPVEYDAVTAELGGVLHCTICDKKAKHPRMLHGAGCSHCPCYDCVSV